MSHNEKKKRTRSWLDVVQGPFKPKAASVAPLRPPGSPLPIGPGPAVSDGLSAQFQDVRRAIERESSKSALEKAKELHKRLGSEESKSLLIDAYLARMQGMLAKDLTAEAKALADLVASRFPEAADRIAGLRRDLAIRTGDMAALVAPLADPDVVPEKRMEAEQAIRHGLIDLSALAACPVLPDKHPLRVTAAVLARAFAAVTTGAVDDSEIGLADVSHRSPLAAWKSLIRAIACLHRGEDESCRRFLTAIDDDCAPARAAGVLRSVLTESWDEPLTPAGRRLVEKIVGPRIELRAALRALNEAFSQEDRHQLYRQIWQVVQLCERICPQVLERLRQHISVKAAVADCRVEQVVAALGGRTVHDAYFWRLFARATEASGDFVYACGLWDHFRTAAVEEGLFTADGPENAFLYLHMAELLRRIPPDHLAEMRQDWGDSYADELDPVPRPGPRSGQKPDRYFLFPERLYERACTLRSEAEIYKEWLDYARTAERPDAQSDEVALQWAAAFPEDRRPLLHLAQSAEGRDAFDKALKYIDQAERLGGVDPKVKRARFRLLVAKTVRHLKQGKLDLAGKDFVPMEQLPQAAEKDRPAFVASLKWVHALLRSDQAEVAQLDKQVRESLGGPVAAAILLLSTARECEYFSTATAERQKWLTAYNEKDLMGAIVRTCPVGTDVNIEILLPAKWGSRLTKWFRRSDCELDSAGLLTLAEAALTTGWLEVAYYCCGYGLRSGGPTQARFLFLRGRSLPYSSGARRQDCFAAALELAKRVRDLDLVAEIADVSRRTLDPFGGFSPFGPGMADVNNLGMDDETLKKVTDLERRSQKYPKGSGMPFFGGGRPSTRCPCPACRRARGEAPRQKLPRKAGRDPKERYLFDDVFDDDDVGDEIPAGNAESEILDQAKERLSELTGMPPELVELMVEVACCNGGRIPQGKREMDRIIAGHPELQRKLEKVMLQCMLEDGSDLFSESDFDELPDSEDEPPSRRFWPRIGRGGRRKRKRRR